MYSRKNEVSAVEGETGRGLRRGRSRKALRRAALFAMLLVVADGGLNLWLRRPSVKRALTARLERAFGRKVRVESYGFSLLSGARLEANGVRVAEDPRFGGEYFLRADVLTVGPRWSALAKGRIAPGTLSLEQPSLNLVISEDGKWNLAEWLPRPAAGGGPAGGAERFTRLEVNHGRINFKRGKEKLAFALVEATGYVEENGVGRWEVDLEAQPWRAAVQLQQAGELRLRGTVGGVSSRFRPVDLELDWAEGSISDLLRLVWRYDYGARGAFSGVAEAHSDGPRWAVIVRAQVRRLHRWDLAMRADNPVANVNAKAEWLPESGGMRLEKGEVELPRSKIEVEGGVGRGEDAGKNLRLEVRSEGVNLEDVLAWLRAFRGGVASELGVQGTARVKLEMKGWPPQPVDGEIDLENAKIEGGSLRAAVHAQELPVMVNGEGMELREGKIGLGTDGGDFQVQGKARWGEDWPWKVKVEGKAEDAADLVDLAAAFGWNLPEGWGAQGPVEVSLGWKGNGQSGGAWPRGEIRSEGLAVRTPFLSQAARLAGQMGLAEKELKIALNSSQALGTNWSGTLERDAATKGWRWNLRAEHIQSAEIGRWVNAGKREGLLSRLLPFLNEGEQREAEPKVKGKGKLSAGEWDVGPAEILNLRAESFWDGKKWGLDKAQGQIAGGSVQGSMRAISGAKPEYGAIVKFDRVDLGKLSAGSGSLRGRLEGKASGEMQIEATGLDRNSLGASLECRGAAEVEKLSIKGMDLKETIEEGKLVSGRSEFRHAETNFRCGGGSLTLDPLKMGEAVRGSGSGDYGGSLNFQLETQATASGAEQGPAITLTGTMAAPKIARRPAAQAAAGSKP